MDPLTMGLGMAAGNLLGGAASYGMSEMFKPKGIDIGQLKNTLSPQLKAGQFQQQFGQNMMDPRGSYQQGVANQIGNQQTQDVYRQKQMSMLMPFVQGSVGGMNQAMGLGS